jgi:hypothetical protein
MAEQISVVDPASGDQNDRAFAKVRGSVDKDVPGAAATGGKEDVSEILTLEVTGWADRTPKSDFATAEIGGQVEIVDT